MAMVFIIVAVVVMFIAWKAMMKYFAKVYEEYNYPILKQPGRFIPVVGVVAGILLADLIVNNTQNMVLGIAAGILVAVASIALTAYLAYKVTGRISVAIIVALFLSVLMIAIALVKLAGWLMSASLKVTRIQNGDFSNGGNAKQRGWAFDPYKNVTPKKEEKDPYRVEFDPSDPETY